MPIPGNAVALLQAERLPAPYRRPVACSVGQMVCRTSSKRPLVLFALERALTTHGYYCKNTHRFKVRPGVLHLKRLERAGFQVGTLVSFDWWCTTQGAESELWKMIEEEGAAGKKGESRGGDERPKAVTERGTFPGADLSSDGADGSTAGGLAPFVRSSCTPSAAADDDHPGSAKDRRSSTWEALSTDCHTTSWELASAGAPTTSGGRRGADSELHSERSDYDSDGEEDGWSEAGGLASDDEVDERQLAKNLAALCITNAMGGDTSRGNLTSDTLAGFGRSGVRDTPPGRGRAQTDEPRSFRLWPLFCKGRSTSVLEDNAPLNPWKNFGSLDALVTDPAWTVVVDAWEFSSTPSSVAERTLLIPTRQQSTHSLDDNAKVPEVAVDLLVRSLEQTRAAEAKAALSQGAASVGELDIKEARALARDPDWWRRECARLRAEKV